MSSPCGLAQRWKCGYVHRPCRQCVTVKVLLGELMIIILQKQDRGGHLKKPCIFNLLRLGATINVTEVGPGIGSHRSSHQLPLDFYYCGVHCWCAGFALNLWSRGGAVIEQFFFQCTFWGDQPWYALTRNEPVAADFIKCPLPYAMSPPTHNLLATHFFNVHSCTK